MLHSNVTAAFVHDFFGQSVTLTSAGHADNADNFAPITLTVSIRLFDISDQGPLPHFDRIQLV